MGNKTHNPEKRTFRGKSYKKDGNKKGGKTIKEAKESNTKLADIDLFENFMFGVELPDSWISPFPSVRFKIK
jgi:hypothetical protein